MSTRITYPTSGMDVYCSQREAALDLVSELETAIHDRYGEALYWDDELDSNVEYWPHVVELQKQARQSLVAVDILTNWGLLYLLRV